MANIKTFPVSSLGGLDLVTPPHLLAQKAGMAVKLQNYEVLPEGGYRRIKGFTKLPNRPSSGQDMRGVHIYNDQPVVVKGSLVYHLQTSGTWALVYDALAGVDRVQMVTLVPADKEVLFITDAKAGSPVVITEDSPGSYSHTVCEPFDDLLGAQFCEVYQDHVVVAGMNGKPGEVYVSTRFDPTTFTGAGSWSFKVQDEVTGLKTFRDYLYVFCRESIHRVHNLSNQAEAKVEPVTRKIGCVDGFSIQEVGGDVLFLANDGLRYLGATERIDDVSLDLKSELITPILEALSRFQGNVSSCVIPDRRQYRMFYTSSSGVKLGIMGTLGIEGQFAWSTAHDMNVEFIYAGTVGETTAIYHCDRTDVYRHDDGDTFDGREIHAVYASPYINLGDGQVRKVCHSMTAYIESEDISALTLTVRFDYESTKVLQPPPFELAPIVSAARYGQARFGQAKYGAIRYPLENIFLEGSGKWLQFEFADADRAHNSQYILRGFDFNFTPAGRI